MSEESALSVEDLPQVIPLFPLDGALLLPKSARPLNIFEPRYLNMLDDVMAAEDRERLEELLDELTGLKARLQAAREHLI